jgi:propanol-preferring alcohol dehydrogenase
VKAIKVVGKGRVEVIDVAMPVASAFNAVVQVVSSGICGTDLELLLPSEQPLPVTPGHEMTGIVHEAAANGRFKRGDRVFINCHSTCGICPHCRNGDLVFCRDLRVAGFDFDGGDAEYIEIPDSSLRLLPQDISFDLGVLIGDALGTPFHALKRAHVEKGEIVAVSGLGPLGQMAIACAKSLGARVVAVDMNRSRLDAARRMGADYTIDAGSPAMQESILSLTEGKGFDKVIECSGREVAIMNALKNLKPRGRLVQVGVCPALRLDTFEQLIKKEIEIVGSRNFNDRELPEVIGYARRTPGVLDVVTRRFRIEEAQAAFDAAKQGTELKIVFDLRQGE